METSAVFYLILVLPCLNHAGPMKERAEKGNLLLRFAQDTGLIRAERQSNEAFMCQMEGNNTDCLPAEITSAPTSLVNCLLGKCVCNDCFMRATNGTCRLCQDYLYSDGQQQCVTDNRPSQLTAFLLSLFLSSTGAANFYIGQNSLAGGQLFLLILIFSSSYVMCCMPCCLGICIGKEDVKGSCIFILLTVIFVVVVILAAFSTWAWWLADLIIFATNKRLAGSGCELQPTL